MEKMPTINQLRKINEAFEKEKIKIFRHVKYTKYDIYFFTYKGKYYEVYGDTNGSIIIEIEKPEFDSSKGDTINFDTLPDINKESVMGKFGVVYNTKLNYAASSNNIIWTILSGNDEQEISKVIEEYIVYYELKNINDVSVESTAMDYRYNNILTNWAEAYDKASHTKYKDIFNKIIKMVDVREIEKNLGRDVSLLENIISNQTFRKELKKPFIQFIKELVINGADVQKFLRISKNRLSTYAGSFYNADNVINELAAALGVKVTDLTDLSKPHKI